MRHKRLVVALALMCSVPAIQIAGQSSPRPKPAVPPAMPRMPDGRPDLQGMWTNVTITRLERPDTVGGKLVLSAAEAAAYEREFLKANDKDRRDGGSRADVERAYNAFFWDSGTELAVVNGQKRTSLIVDPQDGRIPALTSDAQKNIPGPRPAWGSAVVGPDDPENAPPFGLYDNPEERPLAERCLLAFGSSSGPPMLPIAYNNHYQIVQTPGHVMIMVEMVHDVRIIPTDGRAHGSTRRWLGDSVGRWDGDTFVVDTINFKPQVNFRGSSQNLHVIERFTRTDANTILYTFTIDDPTTWTRRWTGEIPLRATDERLYEYACHEANYGLEGVLRGARAQEKQAVGSSPAKKK
jgi:hypothetical protein